MCYSYFKSDNLNIIFLSDYNIYKDASPMENTKALAVINQLLTRVHELLLEWPEHPTLIQVNCYLAWIIIYN